MLQSPVKKHRERVRPKRETPIRIVSVSVADAVMTITFDQPVSLKGVPAYVPDVGDVSPVSATMTDPTTLEITFSASVATATKVTVPYEEPAIRNKLGGFVADSTVTV